VTDELIACCDLCEKPLMDTSVEVWKWVLHPRCAETVRARLERFVHVIFDMTDEEFEAFNEAP